MNQSNQQQQQQRNRLPSSPSPPLSVVSLTGGPNANTTLMGLEHDAVPSSQLGRNNNNGGGHHRSHSITNAATTSLANLLDGFTARVSTAVSVAGGTNMLMDRSSQSAASTPGSTHSIASLTSMGSLGTTANALYSSIGSALNSITSPIQAAAAAATATTTEVVVAAASVITNHLSSPTSGTPPHGLDVDEGDDECDDCEEDEDDPVDNDGHIAAPTPNKSWAENKQVVQEIRKKMCNLSSMVPTNVQFRHLSDGRARCYFLGTPPQSWETTLLFADINLTQSEEQQLLVQRLEGIASDEWSPTMNAGSPTSSGHQPAFLFNSLPRPRYVNNRCMLETVLRNFPTWIDSHGVHYYSNPFKVVGAAEAVDRPVPMLGSINYCRSANASQPGALPATSYTSPRENWYSPASTTYINAWTQDTM